MKKLMVIFLLCLSVLCLSASGQSTSSGHGFFAGAGSLSGATPPAYAYAARTDPCVIGYAAGDHTNCLNGATTGQAGSALSFLGQNGDPMPWYQTAGTIDPVNTAVTDPDFGSYQIVLTSGSWGYANGFSGTANKNYNEQAGEFDPFSEDSSLLLIANDGGQWGLVALDVALIHAKGCSPSEPCSVWTGIYSRATDSCTQGASGTGCTALNLSGEFTFSRTPGEAHVIYELMGTGTGADVQVNKLTVTCPSGAPHTWGSATCTFARAVYVNFTSGSTAVLPSGYTSNSPWTGAFAMANDGTVGYAAGGAGEWQASTTYNNTTVGDAFIYPSVNNASNYAFQATTPGTSGSTEPNWHSSCNTVGSTCTDGTTTWTNIGKLGGQGPGFDLLYYSPTLGARRLNTLTGYIFNASGYSGSSVAGYAVSDTVPNNFNSCLDQYDTCAGNVCTPPGGTYAGYASAGTPPGTAISGCQTQAQSVQPFTDQTTLHDGGIKSNPRYLGWTPTGGGSNGGSFVNQVESCRNSGSTYPEISCYHYFWDTGTDTVRGEPTWTNWSGTSVNGQSASHAIDGYNGLWQGDFGQFHAYNEPNFPNTADYEASPTCYSASGGSLNSSTCAIGAGYTGTPLLLTSRITGVTGAPWDEHGAGRIAGANDLAPVFFFNTAVPATGREVGTGYPGSLPGYNEITGMGTQSIAGCSSTIATYCQYRFAHNWGTGSVFNFNGQNEQGMNSQDGTFAALATDVMGTRGSISPDWTATNAYVYGAIVNPVCSSSCTNALHSSFQQLNSAGCTAGSTEPGSWPQSPGNTVSDGSCTWQNVSGTYGSEQLPCNGLRADLQQTTGATIYLGTQIFDLSSANVYQATGCAASSTCSAANGGAGLTSSLSVAEGTMSLSSSPAFMTTVNDSNGIVWQFTGQNDCRTDVILVDLLSAKSH